MNMKCVMVREICDRIKTWSDKRHKMRLVCVLFTFENNMGWTDERMGRRTYGQTDGHTIL